MSDYPSLDASLKQLAAHDIVHDPSDFMDGVWQRAGQLGEVADRRRRAALFCSLFVIGLGAGFGTTIMPYNQGSPASSAYNDFASTEPLSPAALLHVGS